MLPDIILAYEMQQVNRSFTWNIAQICKDMCANYEQKKEKENQCLQKQKWQHERLGISYTKLLHNAICISSFSKCS